MEKYKDFYFSKISFENFTLGSLDEYYVVCECYIDGFWVPFTEQIDEGMKPLSQWEDLLFLGTSNQTRYTNVKAWENVSK